jgi:hypothetical protein
MNWESITKDELLEAIRQQCLELNAEELSFFNEIYVPLEKARILRYGNIEEVFIVAKLGELIVFFEDVEEGFEISELNDEGVITEYGASQFTIQHITNQLRAKHS